MARTSSTEIERGQIAQRGQEELNQRARKAAVQTPGKALSNMRMNNRPEPGRAVMSQTYVRKIVRPSSGRAGAPTFAACAASPPRGSDGAPGATLVMFWWSTTAFAQLDPLLFIKRVPPTVIVVFDTSLRMLEDGNGNFYDPNFYVVANDAGGDGRVSEHQHRHDENVPPYLPEPSAGRRSGNTLPTSSPRPRRCGIRRTR